MSGEAPKLMYFCKISGQPEETPCHHASCQSDPAVRIDDDSLISFTTTASNRGIGMAAEIALRRRYPSRKAQRLIRKKMAGESQ